MILYAKRNFINKENFTINKHKTNFIIKYIIIIKYISLCDVFNTEVE
jgi:hypothetical protein